MSDEPTIEEMRAAVEEADAREAEAQAAEQAARDKPYNDFKQSEEFNTMLTWVEQMRQAYIGVDESKFARLDALFRVMRSI